MGKGDKKTKRGKITIGSHGVRRPKKKVKFSKPAGDTKVEKKPKKVAVAPEVLDAEAAKPKKVKKVAEPEEKPKAKKVTKKETETGDLFPEE